MILERIKTGLKKRKVKVFLIFVLFSAFAWLINSLSHSYSSNTSFDLDYVNTPNTLLLSKPPKSRINVKLKAVGFQFLGFEIRKKRIKIDLSKVNRKDSLYYISPEVYKRQVEEQLPKTMTLLDFEKDTIFLDFLSVVVKEVPVIPRINLSLAKNFMIENHIRITPKKVKIKGPKHEIDTISSIRTSYLDLPDLDADFSQKLSLAKPRELVKTTLNPSSVTVSAKVFRFSEKIIDVPVTVVNIPDGTKVRTFPDVVKVLCQGRIENLKEMEVKDFTVIADYAEAKGNSGNRLPIVLKNIPEGVSNSSLLIQEIEFILRRE